MKTNRFDEILRRKLESIQPDFQDQDWEKWRAFRQHASPTFWQTYGHWVGYTVAAITTAVMAVLYVNQSNQNQDLLNEMHDLKQQISSGSQTDRVALDSASTGSLYPDGVPQTKSVPHSDTVYIVERRTVYLDRPVKDVADGNSADTRIIQQEEEIPPTPEEKNVAKYQQRKEAMSPPDERALPKIEVAPGADNGVSANEANLADKTEAGLPAPNSKPGSADLQKSTVAGFAEGRVPPSGSRIETNTPIRAATTYGSERLDLGEITALPTPSYARPATDAYRHLQSRLPRSTRDVSGQRLVKSENATAAKPKTEEPISDRKVEKVAKDERLLPNFGLGLPYRVGIGQQWEGRTKTFGLWNEVLLGQHWSVQTGLSWQKLEDQKFYNDRFFREKMHEDFRKEHAKPLPPSFDIFNITVGTTILRIPLNLSYRNELGHNFALLAGAGTHLNLRAQQTLSFDFKRPTNDFGQQTAERTVPVPIINSMNVLLGAEKRWSPIVLQASTFLNTGLKAFPYLNNRTDVGVQAKILYELGLAKKR